MADVAGVPVDAATAERVANSIGRPSKASRRLPALAFDIEPASFLLVQMRR